MRLSETAQTRSSRERVASLLPGLLCAVIAIVLATAASLDVETEAPPLARVEPTTIDLEPWQEESRLADRTPPPEARVPTTPRAIDSPIPRPSRPDASERAPQRKQGAPAERAFDLRLVAMAPVRTRPTESPKSASDFAPVPDHHRPSSLATSEPDRLDQIARSLPAVAALEVPASDLDQEPGPARAESSARPGQTGRSHAPTDSLTWYANRDREAFLENLAASGTPGELAGDARRTPTARPHVAAASAASDVARDVREQVARGARADGWSEVALDELPACSPPERQDELKKRILLATSTRRARECSHQDGQYRFLETRNLNAFLMWSRANPESSTRARPARDVCDVLERALLCLDGDSTKDLGVR